MAQATRGIAGKYHAKNTEETTVFGAPYREPWSFYQPSFVTEAGLSDDRLVRRPNHSAPAASSARVEGVGTLFVVVTTLSKP